LVRAGRPGEPLPFHRADLGLASHREWRVIFIDRLKGDAMGKFTLLSTSLVVMFAALLAAAPARAQNYITFVKSTGSGTMCTLVAPCGSLQAAHDVTSVGGEIHCLDSGFVFGVLIAKSITIDCAGQATVIDTIAVAAPGIVVTIRNLTLDGFGIYSAGIVFYEGAALLVENCVIENYNGGSPTGGIRFQPSSSGSKLVVIDTVVRNSGKASTGGGVVINPASGGSAQIVLNRVTVDKNIFGIVVDGTGSTGGINMAVTDSVSSGNLNDGIIATTPAGGAPIGVYVRNTGVANNGFGIRSIGSNVTVRVDRSSVTGNGIGLSASGSGALLTFGNNAVRANGSDGAFSGSVALQ
jgi:hypothetical protein